MYGKNVLWKLQNLPVIIILIRFYVFYKNCDEKYIPCEAKQNAHGILYQNISASIGLFRDDLKKIKWDPDPPTHFQSYLELF